MQKRDALTIAYLFISSVEGLSLNAYKDSGNKQTICYGETHYDKKSVSKTSCDIALGIEIDNIDNELSNIMGSSFTELGRYKKAAIISFVYNIGEKQFVKSKLFRKIKEKDYREIDKEFMKWIYVQGKVNKGLINRRKKEVELWLRKD